MKKERQWRGARIKLLQILVLLHEGLQKKFFIKFYQDLSYARKFSLLAFKFKAVTKSLRNLATRESKRNQKLQSAHGLFRRGNL
jgi:hypothetical protein